MGLLGLRKFIDSCGCTQLLPVPVSDAEAEEEALRRLHLEGYREVTNEEEGRGGSGVYGMDAHRAPGKHRKGDGQRGLSSSSHVSGTPVSAAASPATTTASATPVVDHVLVDMNCIVHSCFHQQSTENKTKKQLIQEVLERLRVLLTEVVIPRQSLSLCFDGPAPIAKLQTQRLRRRKVSLIDTGSIHQLNTLSITAGSLFMIELENAIASQFKLNHGRGFLRRRCPVYLYGTTVMGEGEAKISRALAFLAYGPAPAVTEGEGDTPRTGQNADHVAAHSGHRGRRCGGGSGAGIARSATRASAVVAAGGRTSASYHPDDSIVVLGNDIDLVVTCLGATAYHNFSIISPSSLQLIRVSDIIYRWLKATSATRGDTPFSPAQLPSIRIDFIYVFLLNGGDHYVGAGEVAMSLWKRYRSVRAAYPYSTLVSPNLDAIDVDFLADVVQASEYTGASSVEVGMNLLQSALWSLYTIVTGVCPDYNFVPEPEAPQLCHLRAAAAHCQRTHRRIRLSAFKAQSQPLTPLETYVALMPTEATLPKSVVAGLHSKSAYQSILKTLETSNDTAMIAQAAKDAVAVSTPFLTTSEQYLRHFTAPVQLNVVPPRRRLSRHEQHRMLATQGHIQVEEPVPIVKPISMAEEVPYMEVPYPAYTTFLDFYCPLDARTNTEGADGGESAGDLSNTTRVTHVQGRAVSTRPSLHTAAVTTTSTATTAPSSGHTGSTDRCGVVNGVEHRRVYLYQEEAARARQEEERSSAAAKLQRTLDATSNLLQKGHHLSAAQERRVRRKLQRLRQAETAELRSQLAKEDRAYAVEGEDESSALGDELRRFLGDHASSAEVETLLMGTGEADEEGVTWQCTSANSVNGHLRKQRSTAAQDGAKAKQPKRSSDGAAVAQKRVAEKKGGKKRRREELGDAADHGVSLHITGENVAHPRSEGGERTLALKKRKKQR
jgi:hypothetical protein